MSLRDRIQLDDHFASARARSSAAPTPTIGIGKALGGLLVLAGAIAAAWWWALQGTAIGATGDAHPFPTTVAQRQAAVVDQVEPATRGPRLGGETSAQYQARLEAARAQDATTEAAERAAAALPDTSTPDTAAAGRPAAASALPAAIATDPVATPAAPAALAAPDRLALGLARRVNENRGDLAAHRRWLDACQKQHLVDLARAQIAGARDGASANVALVSANNLAADIDMHQREARRIDGLATASEQRLVDYCTSHSQRVPALESPPETVTGAAAQPRAMPAAKAAALTIRPAGGVPRSTATNPDPFASGP